MKTKTDRKLLTTLNCGSKKILELYKTMGFTVEDITNTAFQLLAEATIGQKPNRKIFEIMSNRTEQKQ